MIYYGKGNILDFKVFDVILVGSGISGLYAALNLDERLNILMLSKRELTLNNSALAQGGIAAVLDKENDSFELHIKDTLIAGNYKNDMDHLKILVEQGPVDVRNLKNFGVEFDTNEQGNVNLTLEGGHSRRRIAHHKDTTGFEIETRLIEGVLKLRNVTVVDNSVLTRMDKKDDYFLAEVLHNGKYHYYAAKNTVLATGGIGRVYNYTTNSAIATGDGIQFAYNMGAKIKNISYIQFHPTAFADKNSRESFLISEAVRGEGAYLLNCKGERFMLKYEPERKELAPRDVVSGCILKESKRLNSTDFFLDISHKDSDYVKNRFPMIYQKVLEKGFDMAKEPIPIFPCQHYLMGGIDVDLNSESTINGLYAAGECSHTGVHGQNRLASNSLLEALVFSRLAAEDINRKVQEIDNAKQVSYEFSSPEGKKIPKGVRTEIRSIMQEAFFVQPHYDECISGLVRVKELMSLFDDNIYQIDRDYVEARSITTLAYLILSEIKERFEKGHDK